MRLIHNLASLSVYRQQIKAERSESIAMARVSSGVKISKSSDGPNQLAQSETMRMQIRGLQMAQQNCQDGASMLQNAEGGMDNITQILQRIRELTVSAGGAKDPDDLKNIQGEITQLVNGVNDIANGTEFNGEKLIKDASITDNTVPGNTIAQVGSEAYNTTNIPTFNFSSDMIGSNMSNPLTKKSIDMIDITKAGGIDESLGIVDGAMQTVLHARSIYGALENRFSSTYEVNGDLGDSTQRAESSIRDADLAEEMTNYSKSNILSEVGNALMAQTNKFPQDSLAILQNVK